MFRLPAILHFLLKLKYSYYFRAYNWASTLFHIMSPICLGRIYYVYVYTMRLILIQRLTVFDDSHILVTTRVVQVFMRVRSNSCFLWVTISFFVSYVFLRNRKKTKTNYLTTKMKRKNAHLSLCVVKCLMLEIFKLWTDFLQEKNWQKLEEITKHNYVTAHTLIYYKRTKSKCSKWHKTAILTSYVLQVISAS